ncbi:MAG: 4a-hydroxytetrahydrobiopterin dehydratase [Planctomycetaceae bacterium]|nr:4a-hydroxytetrahydrobiopterin dehydratase [Planctomycetaceae bacterium]
MTTSSQKQLCSSRCLPCEGGVSRMSPEEARTQLSELPEWSLLDNPDRITRQWVVKDFAAAVRFFHAIGELADSEGHHPDLHLVRYRNVTVEIWTHAIQGLSINDFILAAKINQLPVDLKG